MKYPKGLNIRMTIDGVKDQIDLQLDERGEWQLTAKHEAGDCDFCVGKRTSLAPYSKEFTHDDVASHAYAYAKMQVDRVLGEYPAYPKEKLGELLMDLQRLARGASEAILFYQSGSWFACRDCEAEFLAYKSKYPAEVGA